MIVYRVTNLVTGHVYIGAASCPLETRWSQHLSAAKAGRGGLLGAAIREHGPLNFGLTKLVGYIRTKKALREQERAAIIHYEAIGPRGYNTSLGGEGIPKRRRRRAAPAQQECSA